MAQPDLPGVALKRSPLRRRSVKKQTQLDSQAEAKQLLARAWWLKVAKNKSCVVCGSRKRVQAHHVVPAQKIKQVASARLLEPLSLLYDVRNGVALCGLCHDNHTTAKERVPRSKLPVAALAFASELALLYVIDREYR